MNLTNIYHKENNIYKINKYLYDLQGICINNMYMPLIKNK